jgi:thiamine monophosphate synthase
MGVEFVETVAGAVAIPVLAIGGITADRVETVVRAGASGVAVISAILGTDSPRRAAEELRQALEGAWAATERAVR